MYANPHRNLVVFANSGTFYTELQLMVAAKVIYPLIFCFDHKLKCHSLESYFYEKMYQFVPISMSKKPLKEVAIVKYMSE